MWGATAGNISEQNIFNLLHLVPDGAHPGTEGYIMAGRNLAIPLVNAHKLKKAWDKAGLAKSTKTGTSFNRFEGDCQG